MRHAQRRKEAARWLARLQADDVSDRDRTVCEAWLSAAPANRQALAALTEAWNEAGGLIPARAPAPVQPANRVPRRAILVGAAGGGAALVWAAAAPASYATGRGEIRTVRLKDGSRVVLDTSSRVTVSLGHRSRELRLVRGRAVVHVAEDIGRPFLVGNGVQQALAIGGAVEVTRRADEVSMLSLNGAVFVKQGAAPAVRLDAGERLAMADTRPAVIERVDLETASAWQSGRLIFRDEPLARAAAEVNRYSARPLVLADADVARLRISGAYTAHDAGAFARSVGTLFGLRVVEEPGRVVLVRVCGEAGASPCDTSSSEEKTT